jgi:hypothetical protein
MKSLGILSTLTFALSAVACGSLDGDRDQKAPLATVIGQLSVGSSSTSVAPAGNVRVALLWGSDEMDEFRVASDLPVQPVFPSKFRIELRDAPPAAMLFTPFASKSPSGAAPDVGETSPPSSPGSDPDAPQGSSSGGATPPAPPSGAGQIGLLGKPLSPAMQALRVAFGTVVAYEDKNTNGKLDLVGANAQSFVDRIVGANEDLIVVYVDGAIPNDDELRDDARNLPVSGYNLLQRPTACALDELATDEEGGTPSAAPPAPPCTPKPNLWLPMSSLYELALTDSPTINAWMCKEPRNTSPLTSGSGGVAVIQMSGRPAVYPTANDPKLQCITGGSRYIYGGTAPTCTSVYKGACEGTETRCEANGQPGQMYERPTPVPSDWPCPTK